jgi:hypothetical protein
MRDCCPHLDFFQSANGTSFFIYLNFHNEKQFYNIIKEAKKIILTAAISSFCETNEIYLNGIKIEELSVMEFKRILKTKKTLFKPQ